MPEMHNKKVSWRQKMRKKEQELERNEDEYQQTDQPAWGFELGLT